MVANAISLSRAITAWARVTEEWKPYDEGHSVLKPPPPHVRRLQIPILRDR